MRIVQSESWGRVIIVRVENVEHSTVASIFYVGSPVSHFFSMVNIQALLTAVYSYFYTWYVCLFVILQLLLRPISPIYSFYGLGYPIGSSFCSAQMFVFVSGSKVGFSVLASTVGLSVLG